jgi:hypothetical protein
MNRLLTLATIACGLAWPTAAQDQALLEAFGLEADRGGQTRVALEPQEDRGPVYLVVYDVSDLTDSQGLALLRQAIVAEDATVEKRVQALDAYQAKREKVERASTGLVDAVRELLRPPLSEAERVDCVEDGMLILAGRAEQHAWMDDFLTSTRSFQGQILMEAHLIEADAALFDEWLPDQRLSAVLDEDAARALLRKVATSRTDFVSAPKVLVESYQAAEVSVLQTIPYVADYELTLLPDQQLEILDPVIETVQVGTVLKLRGAPLSGDRLAMRCEVTHSTAETPFPDFTTQLGAPSREVTIQLPEIAQVKAQARFDLRPGESVLIKAPDPSNPAAPAKFLLMQADVMPAPAPRSLLPVDELIDSGASGDARR